MKKDLLPLKKYHENFIGWKNPENNFPGLIKISRKYF